MDIDGLVGECVQAIADRDSRGAVREVLERAVADAPLRAALRTATGGLAVLHNDATLTVLNVVWPPLMSLFPHNHLMWAAIGIYSGQEDNAFYRRADGAIVASGGKRLSEGEVVLLGDDVIHAVHNPVRAYTGAIHVYGGDFIGTPRSQWNATTLVEEPYDHADVRATFAAAERAYARSSSQTA